MEFDMQNGLCYVPWTRKWSVDMDMGYAQWTWTWSCSMEGHAAWTWTYRMDMYMDMKHGQGHAR
jgi:hypothetical protein